MARSFFIRSSSILLFITLVALPILHPQFHVYGAPIPVHALARVPAPIPAAAAAVAIEAVSLPSIEDPAYSHIEKRQLLGSLIGGSPSFRNGGGNAVAGGAEQPDVDGVVPGGNTANVGAR
ncbi:hypothetical protein BGZ95_011640 [Linnemannia exigua]|uniref:Uncharacterized protein n=1 Tax=Linnemannia exigua TaxID=604196 RepID=A0AAD4DM37_9FUNG|nr:hypothetical protein BGZ95_011640 [Linnemannia exigua]